MTERERTRMQTEANSIDLLVFRAITAIDRFANDYRRQDALEMARTISGTRHLIRKHMHPKDREATS